VMITGPLTLRPKTGISARMSERNYKDLIVPYAINHPKRKPIQRAIAMTSVATWKTLGIFRDKLGDSREFSVKSLGRVLALLDIPGQCFGIVAFRGRSHRYATHPGRPSFELAREPQKKEKWSFCPRQLLPNDVELP